MISTHYLSIREQMGLAEAVEESAWVTSEWTGSPTVDCDERSMSTAIIEWFRGNGFVIERVR